MARRKPMTAEQRELARARNRAYYVRHREKIAAKNSIHQKRRYERDGDRLRAVARERMKKYRSENVELCRERARKSQSKPAAKKRMSEYGKKWRAANVEKCRLNSLKHRDSANQNSYLRRLSATKSRQAWANRFFMREAYDLARRRTMTTGFAWHVDHIVPLRSKLVCGLHCEQNLAVIPGRGNSSKGNRYWPDMP